MPRPVCHLFCSGREGFSLSSQGEDPHSASKPWLRQNSNNLRIKLFPHCGLLIFSLRQEVGGGVKHYSTAAASQPFILSSLPIMYPRLVSVFIKILKNIPWQKERGNCGYFSKFKSVRLCWKKLARLEGAISFQTGLGGGILKSMFSQKRDSPADMFSTTCGWGIEAQFFQIKDPLPK